MRRYGLGADAVPAPVVKVRLIMISARMPACPFVPGTLPFGSSAVKMARHSVWLQQKFDRTKAYEQAP